LSESGPFEKAQKRHLNVQTLVYVRDDVADAVAAELVSDLGDGVDLRPAGGKERDDVGLADLLAAKHARQHARHRAAAHRDGP
jgi:hypothetical protein